jgi:RHS repeat-associated protein
MLDEQGGTAWAADIGVYGDLRNVVGEKAACPFRWPGQYEDEETGLYYNRFRYYDPEAGEYVSQDPIGILGGIRLHSYPFDPLRRADRVGLIAGLDDPRAGVQSHLDQFDNGSSVFVPQGTLDNGVPRYGQLGRSDGLFVTTPQAADRAERLAGGDREKLKQLLGIPASDWNEPICRVDIPPGSQKRIRMPSGFEEGANNKFRWGGYTSGGMPEAVIDPIPENELGPGKKCTS